MPMNMSRRNTITTSLIFATSLFLGSTVVRASTDARPDFTYSLTADDLSLIDSDGRPLIFSSLKGKWLILFFGYTYCPDFCPTALMDVVDLHKRLGEATDKVRLIFISIDPERDTPPVLREYLSHFDAPFEGLTGSPAQIAAIAEAFGARYMKFPNEGQGYMMGHSTIVYLVDPEQSSRESFPFPFEAATLADTIKRRVR